MRPLCTMLCAGDLSYEGGLNCNFPHRSSLPTGSMARLFMAVRKHFFSVSTTLKLQEKFGSGVGMHLNSLRSKHKRLDKKSGLTLPQSMISSLRSMALCCIPCERKSSIAKVQPRATLLPAPHGNLKYETAHSRCHARTCHSLPLHIT